jgi:tRNA(Ile)-lysidine synthase
MAGALADGFAALPPASAVAVALSGGLDSSVLLHLAQSWCAAHAVPLFAFHVHHGLSPNADAWLAHCESAAHAAGAVFDARRIALRDTGRHGVEQAARTARYRALGDLCVAHGVDLLLTAHHLDDQAETVLLQLLRGSGVAGLSGMDTANTAPALLGTDTVTMARPLLAHGRAELEAYAQAHAIGFVDDESNADPRYARNALRRDVMPALAAHFPGFQARLARSAGHAQAAQRVLVVGAGEDLARCADGSALDLAALQALSADRRANVLRHWFAQHGLRMPAAAWLDELQEQVFSAREDAQPCVTHPQCRLRRHRGRLFIDPRREGEDARTGDWYDREEGAPEQAFSWNGEAALRFDAFGGTLHFEPDERGFDAAWLRGRALALHLRRGGEKLKLGPNRPTRALKYHYQACDVPSWQRPRLPLVSSLDDGRALLYAAGIGSDCAHAGSGAGRIALRWEADPG